MRERYLALAVLLAGIATGLSAPLGAAAFAVFLPLSAVVLGPRVELTRLGQALVSIAAMMAGLVIARATALPGEVASEALSERTLLLGMPMVLIASARAMMKAPLYGEKLTLVATLVALTAAGRGRAQLYPVLAAGSIAFGLLALRANDAGRAHLRHLRARHVGGAVFGVAVALGLALFASWSLPVVRKALLARIMARYDGRQTGFSPMMELGSLSGLLQSDTVTLRVRGPAPPLLRGIVLTRYGFGRWESLEQRFGREVLETATLPPSDSRLVEVERAQPMPGQGRFYFSMLGATDLVSSSGFLDRDPLGVLRPAGTDVAKRIWFREGDAPDAPEPTPAELLVPGTIGPTLSMILLEWGVRDQSPRAKLALIEQKLLSEYTYSLAFVRKPGVDPVLDFLQREKRGHCEYFASAFALLARAARIPSRVVTGYRVTERSPFGYAVVRDRDAHAWVEVWLDDRWTTYDPTPASNGPDELRDSTPLFAAFVDGVRTAWEAVDDWLERRSAFEFSLALVVMVGALVLVRAVRGRERKARKAASDDAPIEISRLAAALARVGLSRGQGETLGSLAARVARSDELKPDLKATVTAALAGYQRLRYGGAGDRDEVLAAVRAAAQALVKG